MNRRPTPTPQTTLHRQPSPVTPQAASADKPAIDLEALADRVYALMKQELCRERERLGRWR